MPDGRDTLAKFYTHTLPTITPKLTSARTKVISRFLTSQLTYFMLKQVTFISHGKTSNDRNITHIVYIKPTTNSFICTDVLLKQRLM